MIRILPPFGLSDLNVLVVRLKALTPWGKGSRKVVMRCDTRESRKKELGRYLTSVDWSVFVLGSCEDRDNLLES